MRKLKDIVKINGKSQKTMHSALCTLLFAFALAFLSSCSMVNEDLEPCAIYPNTFTTVNFVYDYNMQNRDLFNDHVGTVHLYVFDGDQTFLFDSVASRTMMQLDKVNFSMTFDTIRIKPGNKYYFVAMAAGNHGGLEAIKETPGFDIPLDRQMVPGESKLSDYRVRLDRDGDSYADFGVVNYKDVYGNTKEMMDTLWCTKPGEIQSLDIPYVELKPQVEEYPTLYYDLTIPMMRITNSVTVNLVHDGFTPEYNVDRFNILMDFPKGNGTLTFTGDTDQQENQELYYRSLRKEMALYRPKQNNVPYDGTDSSSAGTRADSYALQAVFGLSRLQVTDDSSLQIRDGETNNVLFQIGGNGDQSFSEWLADYFVSHGDEYQDFLDREYEFTIDVHLNDDLVWDWYQIGCEILGWGVREYNYTIK